MANRARLRGVVTPHLDRRKWPEQRRLQTREQNADDCSRLLRAAEKCHAVISVGSERQHLAPVRRDRWIESLFSEMQITSRSVTARQIHDHTAWPEFVGLLHDQFPSVVNPGELCRRLGGEHDSRVVATTLSEHGILEDRSGQYRLRSTAPAIYAALLPELFETRVGRLVGLDRKTFEGRLLDTDALYNALWWPVCDAFETGLLTRNDVPESVVLFTQQLQQ